MVFAHISRLAQAGNKEIQRDHSLPEIALLIYGLPLRDLFVGELYQRNETSRNRLNRKIANDLLVIVHRVEAAQLPVLTQS